MRLVFSCKSVRRSDAHQALDQTDTQANETDDNEEHQQFVLLDDGDVGANPGDSASDHFGDDANDSGNSSDFGLKNTTFQK